MAQSSPLFRAAYQANFVRYNLENRLTFLVERVFATVEAALNFMASHADQVPVAGTLTLYHLSGTGQTSRSWRTRWWWRWNARSTRGAEFQYTVCGNGAWQ